MNPRRIWLVLSLFYVSTGCVGTTDELAFDVASENLTAQIGNAVSFVPVEVARIPGASFKLLKNWDFGTRGTIRNQAGLEAEFRFHDVFGTIANGTNYGAVTAATSGASAIAASGLGLPNDRQPIEEAARPLRVWTADSMLLHVRPLASSQGTVSVSRHDAINGSFTSKFTLPRAGALLGRDLLWETRVRMPKPVAGYWFALWTAGRHWDRGPEMDVLESFGAPHTPGTSFHSDSVGGINNVDYQSWPDALDEVGVPEGERSLTDWHVWTWVYLRDDSYEIFYDGHRVQHGSIHWTARGESGARPTDMSFLFDFSWGHVKISDVNIELPASAFPLTYELDYSRVYIR